MPQWSIGLGTRRAIADYRTLTDPLAILLGALREDDYASLSFSPARGCRCSSTPGRQQSRVAGRWNARAGVTGSLRAWDRGQLFLSAQRRESDLFRRHHVQLSLNIAFDRDSVNVTARQRDDG